MVLLVRVAVTRGETQLHHGQAFLLATEGKTFENQLRRLRDTPAGSVLAQRRPPSSTMLRDKAALASCPPGSIGRAYLDFVSHHGMDEDYYINTPTVFPPNSDRSAAHRWFRDRFEQSHDLRHVLAGYPPDRLGEICLLSFRAGQSGHAGAAILTVLGLLHPGAHPLAVIEAYQRGRRARPTDLLPWEDDLGQSLAAARAWLRLTPTRHYPDPWAPDAYLTAAQAATRD